MSRSLANTTNKQQSIILLLFLLSIITQQARAADETATDDDDVATVEPTSTVDLEWLEGFNGLGAFLAALFLIIFVSHLLIQPEWMMISLMEQYLNEGTSTIGTTLHCEERENIPGSYLVEVIWESREHKYADNPSMKFRFPGAYDDKKFVRRFDYPRQLEHGEAVPVLLPRGNIQPRSGCPREIVERILAGVEAKRTKRVAILVFGSIAFLTVLALAVREVLNMEEASHYGWIALFGSVAIFEAMGFLYTGDQFMKKKRRTFDAARPMVNAEEQRERQEQRAIENCKTVPPFSIPLHEFAGHARATERNR